MLLLPPRSLPGDPAETLNITTQIQLQWKVGFITQVFIPLAALLALPSGQRTLLEPSQQDCTAGQQELRSVPLPALHHGRQDGCNGRAHQSRPLRHNVALSALWNLHWKPVAIQHHAMGINRYIRPGPGIAPIIQNHIQILYRAALLMRPPTSHLPALCEWACRNTDNIEDVRRALESE